MKATLILLLLAQVSWAGPFEQRGLFDFMLEDEASGMSEEDQRLPLPDLPDIMPLVPECPFSCQCHLRVVQCSDLGMATVPKNLPSDTTLLDLQNNKITEIKDGDFKNLKNLHTLILVNNKISKISPGAFTPLVKLERLYLSKNQLKELPEKMPKTLQELRAHENEISKVRKTVFNGLNQMIVIELGTNPLKSSGIENGAFQGMKRLSYIRIADTNITAIPQGLPTSLTELHLDNNKITKVDSSSLKGMVNLAKLGLSFNSISSVENGSLANAPHLREIHLENNKLTRVPSGLAEHKYIQVVYLHNNNISHVGTNDFCPLGYNTKKTSYSAVSLFGNPVKYWEIPSTTFRCVYVRGAIQLGNYK
ncbi:decorin [Meriones unguiculatus]|uniref:decorin n=1 Tax=Meriones unguiculatus TaxID=10047 RepID=UPI000B4F1F1E|nr:decorin [Meriones unguiculatus]XP_021514528.1 decorin [Meriones unguiculatus]XP_021514529.1 decorin [Meriones unguiculatus]